MVDGKAYPIIEIAPVEGFYDYKNKYSAGATIDTCPAVLTEEQTRQMQTYAEAGCKALAVEGYARLDLDLRNTLLAINIADDYYKEKKKASEYRTETQLKDKMVLDMKHEIIELQDTIKKLEKERDEFHDSVEKLEKKQVELETRLKQKR